MVMKSLLFMVLFFTSMRGYAHSHTLQWTVTKEGRSRNIFTSEVQVESGQLTFRHQMVPDASTSHWMLGVENVVMDQIDEVNMQLPLITNAGGQSANIQHGVYSANTTNLLTQMVTYLQDIIANPQEGAVIEVPSVDGPVSLPVVPVNLLPGTPEYHGLVTAAALDTDHNNGNLFVYTNLSLNFGRIKTQFGVFLQQTQGGYILSLIRHVLDFDRLANDASRRPNQFISTFYGGPMICENVMFSTFIANNVMTDLTGVVTVSPPRRRAQLLKAVLCCIYFVCCINTGEKTQQ